MRFLYGIKNESFYSKEVIPIVANIKTWHGTLCCVPANAILYIIVAITIRNIPPSVVMSQKTFRGFPLLSGSIEYSSSPLEPPESRMCLQDWPAVKKQKEHMLILWMATKTFFPSLVHQSFYLCYTWNCLFHYNLWKWSILVLYNIFLLSLIHIQALFLKRAKNMNQFFSIP